MTGSDVISFYFFSARGMHRRGRGKRRGGLKFEQPVDDGEEEDMEVDGEMVEEEEGEEFESEWEFFPLAPHDWHAVKQHCGRMLDARQWDVGSLATLVTETQRRVGSGELKVEPCVCWSMNSFFFLCSHQNGGTVVRGFGSGCPPQHADLC